MTRDARSAYEKWHAALDIDGDAAAPWHALVRAHLEPLAGRLVLEIGCGRGGFAVALAGAGARVTGIDFARSAVWKAAAHGRSTGASATQFAVGDILAIPHADCTFDVVVSCETVEHVPNPRRAVAECARVLRRGGRLYLTTPNYLGLMGLYRVYRAMVGRPFDELGQPINLFTCLPRTIAWVRSAGLRITAVDGSGHYLPVPRRPPLALGLPQVLVRAARWVALHSLVVAEKP